jgi:hypothetical protein
MVHRDVLAALLRAKQSAMLPHSIAEKLVSKTPAYLGIIPTNLGVIE